MSATDADARVAARDAHAAVAAAVAAHAAKIVRSTW